MWGELKMEKEFSFKLLLLVLFWGVFVGCGLCLENEDSDTAVYIVTLKQAPVSHFYGELRVKGHHHHHHSKNQGSGNFSRLDKPRYCLLTNLLAFVMSKLFEVQDLCMSKEGILVIDSLCV